MLAAWAALQFAVYGQIVPSYYAPSRIGASSTTGEALLGNLVSPARGLLVFSPVLLFAIPGVIRAIRSPVDRPWGWAIAVAVVAHWIAISSFPHWWGGLFVRPPAHDRRAALPHPCGRLLAVAGTGLGGGAVAFADTALGVSYLLGVSMAVHAQGAWLGASRKWNDNPAIDRHPQRLWHWHDPQVLVVLRQ